MNQPTPTSQPQPVQPQPAATAGAAPVRAPVTAVLFDRDGVLTNFDIAAATQYFQPLLPISVYALAARWQQAGEQQGFPRNLVEENNFFHFFWEQIAAEFDLDAAQRATLAGLDYTRFVVPYPEVQPVLAQLRRQNLRLGVLSNFSLASLDHSLVSAGLAHYFDAICAAPVIGYAKPAPQAYQIALDTLQVSAEQCLYFDDEEECVAGARALGMRAWLVDRRAGADDWQRGLVASLQAAPPLASRG
jgi:putative hydrolase of the HAD superfamily